MKRYEDFKKVGDNLYRSGSFYFRLFGTGISPNDCWILNPSMKQLTDIETATGNDVYGDIEYIFDVCGTVPVVNYIQVQNLTAPRKNGSVT